MKTIKMLGILLVTLIFISGCGVSRMAIIKPLNADIGKVNSIQVNDVKATTYVQKEVLDSIKKVLVKRLEDSKAFDSVSGQNGVILLDVKVVSFDTGNRFARWFVGGITNIGEGKIVLETIFIDARNGTELAKITTEGTVTAGFFGGSMGGSYSNAVQSIIKYTITNFGKK